MVQAHKYLLAPFIWLPLAVFDIVVGTLDTLMVNEWPPGLSPFLTERLPNRWALTLELLHIRSGP